MNIYLYFVFSCEACPNGIHYVTVTTGQFSFFLIRYTSTPTPKQQIGKITIPLLGFEPRSPGYKDKHDTYSTRVTANIIEINKISVKST